MKTPGLLCENCSSENLRRSQRQTLWELGKMAFGVYPFRCMECGWRMWVSVWLFHSLGLAKCPKCLRMDLVTWPEKYFRASIWRSLRYTFGAHRYRCNTCRYNFISFRPRQIDSIEPGAIEPESPAAPETSPAELDSQETSESASIAQP